ncbi:MULTISPECIES: helix-turn-helix domain-containing protein [unclassified Paenibacillus]|uniref:helix-turn-helix domain-containing protein n=1 Tax=unclassified Paenibacillus TaxID=185978 RepID=UPI002406A89F|nr:MULTISPECIES: helix-turn-helix domain-containing protein [unclassified Paenibacillus]MDF9840834.1 two-component system response regulator YesN [Paenibacillus sp. PastF-2]MDF9847418.1 two-component system response regulator YesN [Paenibacillus sp. PastM-2]MDF9854005.1 two-component system response regulator YesN [Paenibacillus sp. PastF-1]MDH6479277.1 two-component system response regulator YesN [Paenibacillus sp. PastH-2]MDH6506987.1 two-component system response regulator YesN [Paenibacill
MLRFKLKYLLNNKQNRLILFLTISVSLCITLIGLFSYREYRQALDTELNTPNVELLQINVDVTNRAFREADNKAVDLSFNPAVLAFLSADADHAAEAAAQPQNVLKALVSEPDIHAISVINFQEHSVVSSRYGYRSDWEEAPEHDWSGWLEEIKEKPLLIKRRLYTGSDTQLSNTELLSLARPVVRNGNVTGAVLIDLDYDTLFSKMYTHLSSYQFVYNLEGELIYPKINLPVPLEDMKDVLTEIDVSPFAHVTINGQAYMANQAFSNVTGWRLVSLVPMEQLLKNVTTARNMMLSLSLISIAVGCSAIYYYNFAAFRPLKRINRLLSPEQKGGGHGNLYDLEPVIGKLVGEFRSKSLVADWSLPELRSKFLGDLILRNMGKQETGTKWEHYFAGWQQGPFELLVISIDRHSQWAAAYPEEDQQLLKYAMNNMVSEFFSSSWRTVTASPRKDSLVLLLQSAEGENARSLYEDTLKLVGIVSDVLGISVSAGIGSQAAKIGQAARSYTEAEAALSYRLYDGYGRVRLYPGLENKPDESSTAADDTWQQEVLQALKSSDAATGRQRVHRWAEDVRKRGLQPQKMIRMLDDLLEEIIRIAAAGGHALPPELADYTIHQVSTLDLNDIEEMLCRIIEQMAHALEVHRHSKEYVLVQQLIAYMEEHLQHNIGLQDIAAHVNLGVSSVSTIFKEETGTTLYDYLTGLRIEKACELLQGSSLKVAEIAQLVGYQNENSFIRVFRKSKSITPGKFRENSKSSNPYAEMPKPHGSGISDDSK